MARLRSLPIIVAQSGEMIVERDPRRPTGRLLRQGEMESSYVDLAEPTHLEFDYMRWLRIVLRVARAGHVLHIGGAACALARALAAESPDSRQEVCEADASVLALAREHLGLRRAPGLRVRHAEGRVHLDAQPRDSFDAIVIDAFVGARIPEALISGPALAQAARVAPLTLVNVVDDRVGRHVATVAAGMGDAYPRVWALGGRAGNTIVAGERRPAPLDLDRIAAVAAADAAPARLTGPRALDRIAAGATAAADPVQPPSKR